jgi:hypothetical protein
MTNWPGRMRGGLPPLTPRQTTSQSPGRKAGSIERSATATRMSGQCMHPSPTGIVG